MADLISPIGNIIKLALEIKKIADNVKANKAQCQVLSERVQVIADLVKQLQGKTKDVSVVKDAMESTKRCLTKCLTFIQGFAEAKWYKRILDHGAHKSEFKELNTQLHQCIASFNLSAIIDVKLKIEQLFDKRQDLAAEAQDNEQLASMQELILAEHKKEQAKLQEIYELHHKRELADAQREKAARRKEEFLELQLNSIREKLAHLVLPPTPVAKLPVDRNLIVKLSDLDVMGVIGEGSAATVYAGKLYDVDVAIKYLKKLTPESRQDLFREANLLSRLRGESIVRCLGVVIEEGQECLILELMHGGSLQAYLAANNPNPNLQQQWALEIAQGIANIHKQHTIHRDLKPANILLSKDLHAKLADFDLSTMDTSSLRVMSHTSSALEYMAPELLSLKPQATEKSDIYSYGGILFELLTHKPPPKVKNSSTLEAIPLPYKTLIAKCWEENPTKRPTTEEIIKTITEHQPDMRVLYQTGASHEKAGRLQAAQECYLQSAALGYSRSEFRAGMFFLQGRAGTQNKQAAFDYFTKVGSREGHDQSKACYNAASMLEQGDGIPQDLNQALAWYVKAASLGNEDAAAKATALKAKLGPAYQENADSIGQVTMVQTVVAKKS